MYKNICFQTDKLKTYPPLQIIKFKFSKYSKSMLSEIKDTNFYINLKILTLQNIVLCKSKM